MFYTPKMVAVPISITMEEVLNNEGENQIMDVMTSYMDAAEKSLMDTMDAGIYSDGTANGGKQMGGFALAIPIVNTSGTYAGIDRSAYPIWRTSTFDANSFAADIGTQVTSTTIRPMLNRIMTQRSRGRNYADLLLMSAEHYAAYDAATVGIQRITNASGLGKMGFQTLEYIGGGKTAEIVLVGGIGSPMPSNTTIGINTDSLRIRYNPQRNFDKLFEGDGQKPINQDALAQYVGWMGELCMTNPMFNWRFFDSVPAS